MSSKKAKLGFTLIELLVVIAIIGVLASIVLASLNSAREKSRDARRLTDIKQIQLALELYFDGTGSGQYPVTSTTCTDGGGAANAEHNGLNALANDNYIPQIPRDPNLGTPSDCYEYATPTTGSRTVYHLGASLEDTSHSALDGDQDCSSAPTADCAGSLAFTNGFVGGTGGTTESAGACHLASETTRRCYDVVP
jgi:prepilin-type N-terminal cleavage/methylation domain-containing protein